MKKCYCLFIVVLLVFSACGRSGSNWQGSVETVDGIQIVKNSAQIPPTMLEEREVLYHRGR